jgi:hypothetical protein
MAMLNKAKNLGQTLKEKVPKSGAASARGSAGGEYMVALDVGTEFVKALIGRVTGDEVEIIGVGTIGYAGRCHSRYRRRSSQL